MAKPLVLVVDDEPDIRDLLSMTLERMDVGAETCGDLTAARDRLAKGGIDLCLTDMKLPDGDGLELVEWMQSETPGVPVAVITAHGAVRPNRAKESAHFRSLLQRMLPERHLSDSSRCGSFVCPASVPTLVGIFQSNRDRAECSPFLAR